MKSSLLFSVLVAMAIAASPAKADFVNGGFDTGNATGWTTANLQPANSGVVSDSFVDSSSHGFILPHSPHFFASLSSDMLIDKNLPPTESNQIPAEFSQTISTTNGTSYGLSFWANILTSATPGVSFRAYWDGTLLLNIQDPTGPSAGWVNYNYVVTGTGSDTVKFLGENIPRYNGLDDVSLTTALPGNLTTCGIAAVVGLGICGYRRRLATRA